jgi:hypothetical protein
MTVLLLALAPLALLACDPSCDDLEDDAFALRAKYAACAEGESCQKVQLADHAGANNCLLAFQCTHALNAAADLERFGERAREIVEDYRDCNTCAQAGCADAELQLAVCNAASGSCELVDDPDAGAGD